MLIRRQIWLLQINGPQLLTIPGRAPAARPESVNDATKEVDVEVEQDGRLAFARAELVRAKKQFVVAYFI